DAMVGDERVRFCDHCQFSVQNLSNMTHDEAQKIVDDSTGRLCVCYSLTTEGRIQTLDYQTAPKQARSTRFWIVSATVGAIIASIFRFGPLNKPKPTGMVMGKLAPPPRSTSGVGTLPCK